MSGQHLVLDPADREDQSAQTNLAGHRRVATNRFSDVRRRKSSGHRDPGRRAVFGDRSGRHVNVYPISFETGNIESHAFSVRPEVASGRSGRTLKAWDSIFPVSNEKYR